MAAAPAPAPALIPYPDIKDIKKKINEHNSKAIDTDKTLEEALRICDNIPTDRPFHDIINKYDEINDELVQITDYKDQDSGKYKFSRILETYLAIHQIFENYTEHFITNNNEIIIRYKSKEGVLPFKDCYIYKIFTFTTDDENKYYTGLKEEPILNNPDDIGNLKTLLPIIEGNVGNEITIDNTNKELNMYFIEKTTKVRTNDDGTPITNIYSLAKVNKNHYDELELKYYKAVMKNEETNTIEIKLVDANIP